MIRKWIGLAFQWAMAAALAPWVWTMSRSFGATLASSEFAIPYRLVAFMEGAGIYLVIHLAFWKPRGLYLLGHRLLQKIFQILLGGQVQTIPQGHISQGAEVAAKPKGGGEQVVAAVSPALIPVYTLLATLALGLLRSTGTLVVEDRLSCLLLGLTVAFHVLMALDTLQETRKQQTFVAYLLTVELVVLSTWMITMLCLSFVLPDISVGAFFQRAFQETLAIYTAGANELLY